MRTTFDAHSILSVAAHRRAEILTPAHHLHAAQSSTTDCSNSLIDLLLKLVRVLLVYFPSNRTASQELFTTPSVARNATPAAFSFLPIERQWANS